MPRRFEEIFYIQMAAQIVLAALALLAWPAGRRARSWKVFFIAMPKAAFGVVLPLVAFVAGMFFMPEWKGGCDYGWIDCFHIGKLALAPIALYATAALYAVDILQVERRDRGWIVVGLLLGAIVSIVCLAHGVATIGFYHDFGWGLFIPVYVAVWYSLRALQLMMAARIRVWAYLGGLLGSAPFWIASAIISRREYMKLPDKPPDCFVVTAATRGHARVVGPIFTVIHGGRTRRANAQLLTFWRFEEFWSKVSPATHACFRRLYGVAGPRVARLISTRLLADVAYVLLKPAEWLANGALWLSAHPHAEAT